MPFATKTAFCIFMLKKPSVLVVEGFPNYSEHIPAAALFSHSFLWDPGIPEVWSMGLDVSKRSYLVRKIYLVRKVI